MRAEPEVQGGEQRKWLDQLELELDNSRTALEWSLESGKSNAEAGLQMANCLWWFWFLRNSQEGQWLEKTLKATQHSTDLGSRAKALSRLAWVHFFNEASADEGLALGRALGEAGRESVALALLGKGAWAIYQADYASAKSLFEESLALFRELGNRWGMCETLTWLGTALVYLGDPQQAIAPLEESLALARQARDINEIGFAVWQLGKAAMAQGDYVQATNSMEEGLAYYKELKSDFGVTFVLVDLGRVTLEQGDYQRAVSCYKEALTLYWDRGTERNIAGGLENLAAAVMYQQPERAARLLGAAEALRESNNAAVFPYLLADYERSLESLRLQLDHATLATCWAQGKAMNVKQAVKYALEEG
jgi:tetratricopeptide (TPR) repeat protein